MSCLPSNVSVVDTSSFTSEEVIEAAIEQLVQKRHCLDASIEVLQKRLRYIQCLSEPVSSEQYAYMRSLKESSTHPLLPIRERSTALRASLDAISAGD